MRGEREKWLRGRRMSSERAELKEVKKMEEDGMERKNERNQKKKIGI